MTTKNIRMNQKTADGYDVLHPETIDTQVLVGDGTKKLNEKITEYDNHKADTTKHKTGDGLTDLKVKNTDTEVYYYLRIDNDGLYLVEV